MSPYAPAHHWPKRVAIALACVVVLVLLAAAGTYAYTRVRFGEIKKLAVSGLVVRPSGSAPFNLLVAVGAKSSSGAEMEPLVAYVLRVAPNKGEVGLLAIPANLELSASSNGSSTTLSSALEHSPSDAVRDVKADLHIPLSDYVSMSAAGLSDAVNALSGVNLDIQAALRDPVSGLGLPAGSCETLNGGEAVTLLQSTHLYYYESGAWQQDGGGVTTELARDESVMGALLPKLAGVGQSPGGMNALLSAMTSGGAIDSTLGELELRNLTGALGADDSGHLFSLSLSQTSNGAVLIDPKPTDQAISQLLSLGTSSGPNDAGASGADAQTRAAGSASGGWLPKACPS